MLVAWRMTRSPVTIGRHETLAVAQAVMKQHGVRRLPVVEKGEVVGIISGYDLRCRHLSSLDLIPVEALMTENPIVVSSSATLEHAAVLMTTNKVGALPVVDHGRLVGIISAVDMMFPEPRPAAGWWPQH